MSKKRITNFQMDSAKSIQFGYYLFTRTDVICTRVGDGRWHVRTISEGKVYPDTFISTQDGLRDWINHLYFVVDLFIKFDRL